MNRRQFIKTGLAGTLAALLPAVLIPKPQELEKLHILHMSGKGGPLSQFAFIGLKWIFRGRLFGEVIYVQTMDEKNQAADILYKNLRDSLKHLGVDYQYGVKAIWHTKESWPIHLVNLDLIHA